MLIFKQTFFFLLFFICTQLSAKEIIISSKTFSESVILGEMLAAVLEEKFNKKVLRKLNLGGTQVVFNALKNGDIDVYPEYSGTAYISILKKQGTNEPGPMFNEVKKVYREKFQIWWSETLGFNNTYALAVRKGDPRFSNINKISDLKNNEKGIRYISPHEFMERKDGFAFFTKAYGLNFEKDLLKSINSGLMYTAIKNKTADMITSYSTDGRINAYGLKLLKDDLNFFPPYYAAFNIRQEAIQRHPELKEASKLLERQISEAEMTELNDKVDRLKQEASVVAKNFLYSKGILKGEMIIVEKNEGFFSFLLRKKLYLSKIIQEHLWLTLLSLFTALLFSIPLGILMTRRPKLADIIFPIINTLQTIPSLALLGFLIPLVGIGATPAVIALFLYSLLPLVRNTYTGIKGVNPLFIEASRGIGLTNFQILKKVEIPLALPIIMAGIRTASVIIIGTATLAALVGAGGLGDPIFRGVATINNNLILLGAIPSALLAIFLDKILGLLEKKIISKGLRITRKD